MKKANSVVLITLLATMLIFVFAGSASAHTAYRYWTAGTGGESLVTHDSSYALSWIQGKAKGNYSDDGGYRLWVALADRKIDHHNTANNRPGAYWNVQDPYHYTESIQYTLYYMGYTPASFVIDNNFGNQTDTAVELFQNYNGLGVDGVVGTNTYYKMCYSGILGPWGAR